jgi:hypothetical protein
MKLDISKYGPSVVSISRMLNNRSELSLEDLISEIAVATGVHIVAVCLIIQILKEDPSLLKDTTERLTSFYKLDTIVGEKELRDYLQKQTKNDS